jgi:hypothetical protein
VIVTRPGKLLAVAVAVAALTGAAWYQFGGHETSKGQPPLADLNPASLDQLRADFNASAGETRMILLLSPT